MFSMSRMFSRRDKKHQCYRFIILICTRSSEQMETLYNLTPHEFRCNVTLMGVECRMAGWMANGHNVDKDGSASG